MKTKEKKVKAKSSPKKPRPAAKKTKVKVARKPARKPAASKLKSKPKAKLKLKPKTQLRTKRESLVVAPRVEPEIKQSVAAPVLEPVKPKLKTLELEFPVTIKDLAVRLQTKPSILIKKLMDRRLMVGINQNLDNELINDICEGFGFQVKKALDTEEVALGIHKEEDSAEFLKNRPAVVTFMGHVDHGKTSLLDQIRKTRVAESEHGGITQHIGAYQVSIKTNLHQADEKRIVFLDTPGHEAFTLMRARGAQVTDIVVLVVAADDGIMPQTVEAIDHAKEAKVPIIVAVNKIDKPQVNIDRIKKQLAERGLVPEDWQGKTITVLVSAKTGKGIDELLEMILLQAEMLELKANYEKLASGVVVEAKLSKGKGPIATLLVQNGTLHVNDNFVVGKFYSKVKAMFDDYGRNLKQATPSVPVEVLGLTGVPEAGEQFFVVEDEKKAKEIAYLRQEKDKESLLKPAKRISLEHLHAQIQEGQVKELKIILKADVMGSLEAIKESLRKLQIEEISLIIIHAGTGDINTSDVILAAASNALLVGFNVIANAQAKELIAKEQLELRIYNVIYELNNDIKAAVEGMLDPKIKKIFLGRAEVRKIFNLSTSGLIAGCFVTKGKILRNAEVSLIRNGKAIFEGKMSSLKRFKDDVKEVSEGFECGISLGKSQELLVGDSIEAYQIQKIARKL